MQRPTNTPGPTIAAAAVLPALRALRSEGVDTGPITGSLANEGVLTVERRIRYAVASPLWEKAAAILNDPLLGLRCSADLTPTSFGITSLLALSSPTLGEALGWLQRSYALHCDVGGIQLVKGDTTVFLCDQHFGYCGAGNLGTHHQQFALSAIYRYLLAAVPDLAGSRISFSFARPRATDEFESLFGSVPRFSQPTAGIEFPKRFLDAPMLTANAELRSILEAAARGILVSPRPNSSAAGQVRAALLQAGTAQVMTLTQVARLLGVSERTLQRRLREEQTSFRRLVDAARRELAEAALELSDQSCAEMAENLGFSDEASFGRAFKRWTGQAPGRYRRGAQSAA